MDELDLLKKDWKKQESNFPNLSFDEIYKLIHKRSSSIVKYILIICIAELLFWSGINFLVPESYLEIYEQFNLKTFLFTVQGVHYVIVFLFIYLFYQNYKRISVIDNTNKLMRKIIKTRRTVNYYVYYNIILYIILSVILNIFMFSQPEILIETMAPDNMNVDQSSFLNVFLIAQIITLIVVCGLLWLYYRLIYGILLKKLSKNYNELETLDI